ncbi:SigB/SigF/SigG family RNA polymerase sigma factor [Brevibacillus daliensis]|uniref:SigB/SigF/SigG family RNA polymerase sigma factor n=1 Tax=Brevibacillus daliensis TaxID=2892995 RepID=UPI001E5AE157|nr:SigB/SigF/SigG family RNA polymerase sigma factor [Brevibacillus daliensis]
MTHNCLSEKERQKNEIINMIRDFQNQHDKQLGQLLVQHYIVLVDRLVAKIHHGTEMKEDLCQVGLIGLLSALKRYDYSYGCTFESFAIPTILGEMKRYIRDKTWSIHVPRRIKELSSRMYKAIDELTVTLGRSPQIDELAEHLNQQAENVKEALEISKNYRSLSVQMEIDADHEGNVVTILDLIGNTEEGYRRVEQALLIKKLYGVLNEREKEVITMIYYENMNQKEVGDYLGISQMHVSRILRRALDKLRVAIATKHSELVNSCQWGYHTK